MCGICGISGDGNLGIIRQMVETLAHRGPDEQGVHFDAETSTFLGHSRLSIVDILDGKQPMSTSDKKLVVAFNGEIYNHAELRQHLESRGHKFTTDHSDTEVLLHGYREWGTALSGKLNGMWAFSIYDKENRIIYCSRDRFGEKPFYYTCQNGTFIFASELVALRAHPSVETKLSLLSLQKFFAYCFIPAPSSIFENIYKLPAGHDIVFNIASRSVQVSQYWEYQPDPFTSVPRNPEDEWGGKIRELLDRSVRKRMIADVPLGVFLSGGIDSSIITGLASTALPPGELMTFSIGFQDSSFDESDFALLVAKHFKTNHHSRRFSLDDTLNVIAEVLAKTDEPMGDSSNFPFYLLCSEARRKVKVVLSGDGADELFAGYDPFKALKPALLYRSLIPTFAHNFFQHISSYLPVRHDNMSFSFKLAKTLSALSYDTRLWNPIWHGSLTPDDISDLFLTKFSYEELYSEALGHWRNCSSDNIADQTIQFYIKMYLQDRILVKSDRLSMLHGLEVRSPFLDYDLVDFVRRIPYRYKMHKNMQKYILKSAFKDFLPSEIINRKKKGFGSPIGTWFKEGAINISTSGDPLTFSSNFLIDKRNKHVAGTQDNRLFLLNQKILESFLANKIP